MNFSKISKKIRELIFHKIIKLIGKNSFKYLGYIGQKTNRSLILLLHTIQFLKKLDSNLILCYWNKV